VTLPLANQCHSHGLTARLVIAQAQAGRSQLTVMMTPMVVVVMVPHGAGTGRNSKSVGGPSKRRARRCAPSQCSRSCVRCEPPTATATKSAPSATGSQSTAPKAWLILLPCPGHRRSRKSATPARTWTCADPIGGHLKRQGTRKHSITAQYHGKVSRQSTTAKYDGKVRRQSTTAKYDDSQCVIS
jgi:hypothetical protein